MFAPFLGFKGGTAALMVYGLDRFSVDLDFDLLDESQEEVVFERVTHIIEKYGTIREANRKRFGVFFTLSDEDKART
ncbi:MAG: nucleotidyl transferase AbiEii/AbiGii toxin family protein [Chloroflexi bacterium]|nr:nucleotidyl transferase AbiEii/AbiGii toxin family protein [Chloroflexota bacterium]